MLRDAVLLAISLMTCRVVFFSAAVVSVPSIVCIVDYVV